MSDGIIFYESANNAILNEGVDGVIHPAYIAQIFVCRTQRYFIRALEDGWESPQ